MKELLNCPNCGAPIESEKCPYCGSVFIDFASVDLDSPFYLKVKFNGKVMVCKARVTSANLSMKTYDGYDLYYDDKIVESIAPKHNYSMDLSMDMIPVDGIIAKEYYLERFRNGKPDAE